jgi:peroxiredoxin Q/BCP
MTTIPKVGSTAPEFKLPDEAGKIHSLKDFAGKTVVLYFYPKDDTPGCTVEACEFRDSFSQLTKAGALVVGISKDPADSHSDFKKKYGLNFLLLSDSDHKVMEAYGSWGEKSMMGKTFMGTLRNTFIIRPDGKIKRVFEAVTPKGHAQQVIDALK